LEISLQEMIYRLKRYKNEVRYWTTLPFWIDWQVCWVTRKTPSSGKPAGLCPISPLVPSNRPALSWIINKFFKRSSTCPELKLLKSFFYFRFKKKPFGCCLMLRIKILCKILRFWSNLGLWTLSLIIW
jgi:hypothetical protein